MMLTSKLYVTTMRVQVAVPGAILYCIDPIDK